MKKFWTILAVAALFVACGGNDKKDEKSAEGKLQKTEQTKEKDTEDNGEKKGECCEEKAGCCEEKIECCEQDECCEEGECCEEQTATLVVAEDVEAKAVEFATKLMNATSEEEAMQIAEEAEKWFDSLSEEETKRATEAMLMM